jgi:hypothetical protein
LKYATARTSSTPTSVGSHRVPQPVAEMG